MRYVQLGVLGAIAFAGAAAALTPQTEPIGPYRRAFRAECVKHEDAGYCECITSGFAQSLGPQELTMARYKRALDDAATPRARAAAQRTIERASARLGFATPESRSDLFNRINALEADLQTTCGKP